jgi:hypothetical protein
VTDLLQLGTLHKFVGLLLSGAEDHCATESAAVDLHHVGQNRGALVVCAADGVVLDTMARVR